MKTIVLSLLSICLFLSCSNNSRNIQETKYDIHGNDYRLFKYTPAWELAKAVQDEDIVAIENIISSNPNVINYQDSIYGNTLLMLAITNQQFNSFKTLLEKGADVNIHDTFDGTTALIDACSYNFHDIKYAQMLVAYGADVNDIETGNRRDGNSTRLTPLIAASKANWLDMVKYLISKGANVNYQNEFGQSALSESVILGNYEVAYYLLLSGADYKKPIFCRPDYTIPLENVDSNDKGKPIYLSDILKEDSVDVGLKRYRYKVLIEKFLENRENL